MQCLRPIVRRKRGSGVALEVEKSEVDEFFSFLFYVLTEPFFVYFNLCSHPRLQQMTQVR